MDNPLIDVLFTYDAWATRHLLEECCRLTQEQFEQPLGLGFGNLERTLAHLVGAMVFFTDWLNQNRPRARPDHDGRRYTPAELLTLFNTIEDQFREAITRSLETHSLTDLLNLAVGDSSNVNPAYQKTYAIAIAQMIDHSIHHRTQAVDMLRLLEVDLPMEWHPFEWEKSIRSSS